MRFCAATSIRVIRLGFFGDLFGLDAPRDLAGLATFAVLGVLSGLAGFSCLTGLPGLTGGADVTSLTGLAVAVGLVVFAAGRFNRALLSQCFK
jgi:hypothetical protein